MRQVSAIAGVVLLLALNGCTRESPAPEGASIPAQGAGSQAVIAELPGDEEILARVGGSPITRFDLEQAMDRMLGPDQAALLDEAGRRRVLESLVMSRAMAQAVESELDAETKLRLDRQAAAYREELLVKLYLAEHTEPRPVTQDMVKRYYERHPERFGGRVIRHYESMTATGQLEGEALRKLLAALGEARLEGDWPTRVKNMQAQGFTVHYRTGQVDERLLQPRVRNVMKNLQVGEASRPFLVDGTPQVVRITSQDTRPPRPLREVSGEIRRALVPIQIKEAVKAASAELMNGVDVQYQEDSGP